MKLDVLSSYILSGLNIIFRFFLIPIYIKYIGLAAYGIIGFYGSIQAVLVLFEFGMGLTSNKILAEETVSISDQTKRTLKSVELIYLTCALMLGLIIILFANQIAQTWLHINDKSINGQNIVRLMGVLFIVSWPKSLYNGFLTGQKKILLMNTISTIILLIQNLLLFLIITKWNSTLNSYFYILIFTSFSEIISLRYFATSSLKPCKKYASRPELNKFYSYSSGVIVFSILSLLIFQFDKFYISYSFPIESLGIYNLAGVIPFAMLTLIYPITTASFPRIVKIKESIKASNAFIDWSTLIFLISSTYFAIVAFNFSEIHFLWLKGNDPYLNKISLFLLIGLWFHTGTNMIVSALIANGKVRVVWIIYLVSIIVYLSFIALLSEVTIESLAKAWILLNISLLSSAIAALFNFDKFLANRYLKRLFLIILSVGGLSILLYSIEYFNLMQLNTFLKLILYLFVFGTFFISVFFLMLRKKMLK